MPDQTLGERVGALEDAVRSISLQLNGDPELRIPGRLEQLERELADQRTQLDRVSSEVAATAQRRRELRESTDIALDEIHSRIDQTERDEAGHLAALGRRYVLVMILAVGSMIAGAISTGMLYMLYLELIR